MILVNWGHVVTLVATFSGAMVAFLLESWRGTRSEKKANLASSRLAFFKLVRMLNRLENIKLNYVDPHRGNVARCLSIPATLQIDMDSKINMESLQFMFVRHANLLGEISISEDQYSTVIGLINERSRFMLEQIQPRLKAAGLPQEFEMDFAELDALLGPGNLREATNLTDQLVSSVDSVTAELLENLNSFGEALKEYFDGLNLRVELEPA